MSNDVCRWTILRADGDALVAPNRFIFECTERNRQFLQQLLKAEMQVEQCMTEVLPLFSEKMDFISEFVDVHFPDGVWYYTETRMTGTLEVVDEYPEIEPFPGYLVLDQTRARAMSSTICFQGCFEDWPQEFFTGAYSLDYLFLKGAH